MLKIDLFLKAMKTQAFRHPAWIRGAFGVVEEDRTKALGNLFPYRVLRTGNVCFVNVPELQAEGLQPIDDAKPGQPVFFQHEEVTLTAAMGIPGITKDTPTTYGRWLQNEVIVFYPFGDKIPFINDNFKGSTIENITCKLLQDNPETVAERDPKAFYVDEHLKFTQAVRYLEQFTHLFAPAGSLKTITAAPGINQLKKKLFEENRENISDPAVLAKIGSELETFDRANMKGDIGEDVLLSKKAYGVVRRKLFGFQGGEAGFDDGQSMVAIENSLEEGWDIEHFAAMNDVLRVGSYNRGFQTALGGAEYKDILRATSNCQITEKDCGSIIGIPMPYNEEVAGRYLGLYAQVKGIRTNQFLPVGEHHQEALKSGEIYVRSGMFCRFGATDYCQVCSGDRLSRSKTGLSGAASQLGATFLALFMAAMHGKALEVAQYNFEECVS